MSVQAVGVHPFLLVCALAGNICAAKPVCQQGGIVSPRWVVVISSVYLIKWPLGGSCCARLDACFRMMSGCVKNSDKSAFI